jgi:hypothetical protein
MRRFVLVTAAASTFAGPAGAPAQADLSFARLAETLVERMALQSGERVLLVGAPGRFEPLVPLLRAAVVRAGGTDLGAMTATGGPLAGDATTFVAGADGLDRARLAEHFGDVDLAVMLPGAEVADPPYAAMQDVLRARRGRTIHFHWSGAYDADGNAIEVTPAIDAVYQHALLETDYAALAAAQTAFEAAMRAGEVRVTTPAGTDLRFRIGERPVTKQDGDASAVRASAARNLIDREVELPAGAIRVAPLEATVSGIIALPISIWNGTTVRGLTLRLERGRVVEARAEGGGEAVEMEMGAGGAAARAFREFALGFNPLLAIPAADPWVPYYGYGAGVVRLSLGDNTELGGVVAGGYVRWNFFIDATVRVGDEVWVRDGKVVAPRR